MTNWQLQHCCDKGQVAFIATVAAFIFVILILWRTPVLIPFKLITVYLHEVSHALAAKCTCGKVEGIEVNLNEGGVTHTRGGATWVILPAGYLGSSFWGMVLIIMSPNHVTVYIAAGVLVASLFVVLFLAKNWTLRWLCVGFIIFLGVVIVIQALTVVKLLRYTILFIGVMNCMFSVYDIYDDLISRRVHSSDSEKFAELYPFCPCNGVAWGVIWGFISLLCLCASVYLGLGSIPSLWAIILMASLSLANITTTLENFSWANITNVGFNLEGTMFSSLVFSKLCSFIVCLLSYFILIFVLTLWRLRHGQLQPAGDNVPGSPRTTPPESCTNTPGLTSPVLDDDNMIIEEKEQEKGSDVPGLERTPTLAEDSTSSPSPTSLPSVDHLSENITRDPSPTIAPPLMPSQEEVFSLELDENFAAPIQVTAVLLVAVSAVGIPQPYRAFGDFIAYVDPMQVNIFSTIYVVCNRLSCYLALVVVFLRIVPSLPLSRQSVLGKVQRTRITICVALTFLCTSIVCFLVAVAANFIAVLLDERTAHGRVVVATRVVVGTIVIALILGFIAVLIFRSVLVFRYTVSPANRFKACKSKDKIAG